MIGYGWCVSKGKIEVARGFGLYAHMRIIQSNIAEYMALIEGLEALADLRLWKDPIEIRGDAKGVIDQMKGVVSISSNRTRKIHRRATLLSKNFDSLVWTWVPRKENKLADELSRRGLQHFYSLPDAYENAMKRLRSSPKTGRKMISLFNLSVFTSNSIANHPEEKPLYCPTGTEISISPAW